MTTNNLPKAIFAAGCFWGVQYYFDQVPGVVKTTVGYTGGHTDHPTYEKVCTHTTGHAEAILIEFDPQAVIAGNSKADLLQGDDEQRTESYNSYDEGAAESTTPQKAARRGGVVSSADQQAEAFRILLRQFFRMHDPTQLNRQGPDVGDSYRTAIFYFDDEQKATAEAVKSTIQTQLDKPIVTEITAASAFYPAEDYHQKFTERTGRGICHIPYEPISNNT